ncbi:MAG TPA: acylneuraminate cytidylyltransferase family protein [Candidatus Methylomirabilis sp.]|nr:acylneuraminate cytidylyltransferase family protein [Candidatus Methylomirabilis sp.]
MTETIVGLIPARGGSKVIPDKNILPVGGLPLIAWTIAAAKASKCLHRVIVSTDSPTIGGIAREHGAETPFLRPAALARDDTPGIEAVIHAVRWLDEHEGFRPHCAIVLQPTSPLRTAQDIEAAIGLAKERQADAVVSVCEAHQHPYWMKRMTEDGRLSDMFSPSEGYTRRQDLPRTYSLNGAIYLVRREILLERRTFYTERTYGYIMPSERSLDIDTPWDLYLADLILKQRGCTVEHD